MMINWDALNWVDYIIFAVFFFSILTGFSRGLIKEVISLAAFVAAIVIASMYAQVMAASFTNSASVQSAVSQASTAIGADAAAPVSYAAIGVSFALLFVCTLLVGSIIGAIIGFFFQTGALGFLNRLLGGVFGVARGFLLNLVLIFLFQLTSFSSQPWWQQSQMVLAFQPYVERLGTMVSPMLANMKEKMGQTLQDATQAVQDAATTVTNTVNDSATSSDSTSVTP